MQRTSMVVGSVVSQRPFISSLDPRQSMWEQTRACRASLPKWPGLGVVSFHQTQPRRIGPLRCGLGEHDHLDLAWGFGDRRSGHAHLGCRW